MKTGEEVTNTNPIDTNVNDKSPKFTSYELLWLSKDSGKKKNHYLQESDWTEKEPSFLHFSFEDRKFTFRSMLEPLILVCSNH